MHRVETKYFFLIMMADWLASMLFPSTAPPYQSQKAGKRVSSQAIKPASWSAEIKSNEL
jgi:hypothetical protein